MIRAENFHKAYDRTLAVAGLSFQVAPGQILGLVGPNGAGKTTTLRALAGIIPPSRGELFVGPHEVTREPIEAKRRLAYIPDDPQLFSDLSVAQHLAFFASAYQVPEASQRAAALLDQFELAAKRDTPAGDLSRGMRQKLAICCGYLHEPAAILFDEPLTGLDPHGIRTLKQSIRDRAERGAAVMVSSHLLAMVEDICTHVLILTGGTARFCGTLADFKHACDDGAQPASLEDVFFKVTGQAEVPTDFPTEFETQFQPGPV